MAQSKRERQEQAGAWLRQERQAAGFDSARSFATALGIDPSRVSRYETGADSVVDDVADKIADALKRDIVTVRRHLGLWVPDEASGASESFSLDDIPTEDLMHYLERRLRSERSPHGTGARGRTA